MRACAYLRTTEGEELPRGSLAHQRHLVEELSAEQEVSVHRWYAVEEQAAMLEDLEAGVYDTVVVLGLDSGVSVDAIVAAGGHVRVLMGNQGEPPMGLHDLKTQKPKKCGPLPGSRLEAKTTGERTAERLGNFPGNMLGNIGEQTGGVRGRETPPSCAQNGREGVSVLPTETPPGPTGEN